MEGEGETEGSMRNALCLVLHGAHQALTDRAPTFERWGIELRHRVKIRRTCGNSEYCPAFFKLTFESDIFRII
jgi:hypothetical protein